MTDYTKNKDEVVDKLMEDCEVDIDEDGEYFENLLAKLIRERRKIPKWQRMKMKEDSVDEVNTTDLEGWDLRRKRVPVTEQEAQELNFNLWDELIKHKPIDILKNKHLAKEQRGRVE